MFLLSVLVQPCFAEPQDSRGSCTIRGMQLSEIYTILELTPAQLEKIAQIGSGQYQSMKNMAPDARKNATKNIGGGFLDVLTPEQRKKYIDLISGGRYKDYISSKNSKDR